jgi:hypothetical protein
LTGSVSRERAGGTGDAFGRHPARRRRPLRIASVTIGVLLFLAVSAVVARFFAAENVERDHELILIQAEAKGDVAGMLAQLSGCASRPACVTAVRSNAERLRRAGTVQILSTQSSTNHSLTGSRGQTRVAWKVGGRFPVVQCVRVRRGGNFLTGISVALLAIGPQIAGTADC